MAHSGCSTKLLLWLYSLGGCGAQRVLDEVDGDAVLVAEGRVETDDQLARWQVALGVDLRRQYICMCMCMLRATLTLMLAPNKRVRPSTRMCMCMCARRRPAATRCA